MDHPRKPSGLNISALLMSFPFSVDTKAINNPLMEEIADRSINYNKAFDQFITLYHSVTRDALVYLLPSEGDYQDQVYVANLGAYIPHKDVMLIANFKSGPRIGEDVVGNKFFTSMGYKTVQPPH